MVICEGDNLMLKTSLKPQENGNVFSINKYLQHSLTDESLIIQTNNGITKVTDNRMINLLKEWDAKGNNTTSITSLENIFAEDTLDAIEYFKNYGIISDIKDIKVDVNGVLIVSNTHLTEKYIFETLNNQYSFNLDINTIDTNAFLDIEEKQLEKKLIVVVLNPYEKTFVDLMLRKQKKLKDSITLMGYVYANNFYMDCLYNYDWKLPCHNCHMGHIKSNLYLDDSDHVTYQQLIDHLYSETDEELKIGTPLTPVQELNIACLVVNKVNKYINNLNMPSLHVEEFNTCTLLDLKDLKKFEDTSIHWEMCDCYE
ncbi:McbB family protein (plasmid) [Priestia aryabhattai]